MSLSLFWLQCGACGGDSMSLLGLNRPSLIELLQLQEVDILWHPSLSNGSAQELDDLIGEIEADRQPLDILCVEGSIIRGPGGTGMFDTLNGEPKKDLAARLARQARIVVAVGTCSAYGGIPSRGPVEATGLQFLHDQLGGFLGAQFRSRAGLPVINLPGCPCHGDVLGGALLALAGGESLELNELHMPLDWFGMLVHQGCTRNEYHEFRVEEEEFGRPGCLFFHLGCLGPLTPGPCNKLIGVSQTSGTRIGVPCIGCQRPDFPLPQPMFKTRELEGVPLDLPLGVDRAHFLAYKTMAEAAAPDRLKNRKTRV